MIYLNIFKFELICIQLYFNYVFTVSILKLIIKFNVKLYYISIGDFIIMKTNLKKILAII